MHFTCILPELSNLFYQYNIILIFNYSFHVVLSSSCIMNYSKPKRKKYFSSKLMAKKNRDLFVKPGIKGFVCTCNGNEKQCIRESYNILNEYADQLYGEEKVNWCSIPSSRLFIVLF